MNKQLVLPVVLGVIVFGFGFPDSALATNKPIDITSLGDEVGLSGKTVNGATIETPDQAGDAPVALGAGAVAAIIWATMTPSDLGVDSVGTLPTSPFYFLKEWKRGLTRLFTFDSVAKAQLELNITNQIAAEVLEVAKTSSTINFTGLERALRNYTDAQERLRFRITTINGTSNVVDSERLLKAVDEKTAKHAVILEEIAERWSSDPYAEDSARKGSIGDPDFDLLAKGLEDARNNILKTFTITVTPVNDAPSLKQKAADQIASASVAIRESEDKYKEVVFTATNWNAPQTVAVSNTDNDSAGVKVTVPKQTQGATFGEKAKTINGYEMTDAITVTGVDDSVADGPQNYKIIAKAKGNLESAKKSFAEGKYGEAYGLARSAEAIASGVRVAVGDLNGDGRPDLKVAPATPGETTKRPTKVIENKTPEVQPENRGANGSTPGAHLNGAISIEAEASATSTKKTKVAEPSGGSAGPASNYDRDN